MKETTAAIPEGNIPAQHTDSLPGYLWWQTGIIYQVYPRSFMDSNGDGIGDLRGIHAKLDYFAWLGVTAIWLSPIYPSPMADFGYDISDYRGIHPLFGTMADFDELLQEVHARGLKLILDLVPNHTSDEHPWFVASRSSRDDPKHDWYIWKDPAPDGGPPNNWLSVFGGSGWEWDEHLGQYYYHAYLNKQPDLNWRNPAVQQEMLNIMRFWLDKGVDGFRVDVMWHLIKDKHFRDDPPNPHYVEGMSPYNRLLPAYSVDQPEVHDIVAMMRKMMNAYDERVLIGEIYLPIDALVTYYGTDHSGAHLPFNFQLVVLPWDARIIASAIDQYEGALPPGGWPNWVLGNHDKPRIRSRVGAEQARVAAMLLLTLRGTPTMYYGDEIGMEDVYIPPDKVQDPQEKNIPGIGLGRDPERSPMQWNDQLNGGFSTGSPWLPLAEDYRQRNVETERSGKHSMLQLYKQLIGLRQSNPVLQIGDYIPVHAEGNILAYIRETPEQRWLVALNFGSTGASLVTDALTKGCRVILGTYPAHKGAETRAGNLHLRGNEGMIIELERL